MGRREFMRGDTPGTESYHSDLLWDYGLRFLHLADDVAEIGHNVITEPRAIENGQFFYTWPRFTTLLDDEVAAARAHSIGAQPRLTAASGRPLAQVWSASMLDVQISEAILNHAIDNNLFVILGQHLGSQGSLPDIDPPAAEALRLLKRHQDDGKILVARTTRLLRYAANRAAAHWTVRDTPEGPVIDILKLHDIVEGERSPTIEALRGLTFEAPRSVKFRIAFAGELIDEAELHRTENDEACTAGIRWHVPDTTDYSAEFRKTQPHLSFSGRPVQEEEEMRFKELNAKALEWLNDVDRTEDANADKDRAYAHRYTIGRYNVGLERYCNVMNQLGFTSLGRGLDVGSGAGHWMNAYAALNERADGVEMRADFVDLANGVADAIGFGDKSVSVVGDARKLPYEEDAFDTVWSHGMMMFVEQDQMFREMNRVLKTNGYMYLAYTSLGHRLHTMSAYSGDAASNRHRSNSLRMIYNQGLYKLGIFATLRGRVRGYAREDIQQTARYCGFATLGAPALQDAAQRWHGFETTIDIIAQKTGTRAETIAQLAETARHDKELIAEINRATNFGAPEAALDLHTVSELPEGDAAAHRAYMAAALKAGRLRKNRPNELVGLKKDDSDAARLLLATIEVNFARWDTALEIIGDLPRSRDAALREVAAHLGADENAKALASAEGLVADWDDGFFGRAAYLHALELCEEQDQLDQETERFLSDAAARVIEFSRF